MQSVGWRHSPTPMHIMIHMLQPVDAETAYELTSGIFWSSLQKTDSRTVK
jgi:hypothetical protein